MTAREPWRCPACGEVTGPPSQRDPLALCARCRADLRERPAPLDMAAGSFDSFTAVIDALAAELGVPRAGIVRTMIEDIERRVALDRDVLVLLRRLERDFGGRAPDAAPQGSRSRDTGTRIPGRRDEGG